MTNKLRITGFAIAMILASVPAGLFAQDVSLAIVGGRLIDGYGGPPLHNSVVLISGNRISAVGTQADTDIPDGARVIAQTPNHSPKTFCSTPRNKASSPTPARMATIAKAYTGLPANIGATSSSMVPASRATGGQSECRDHHARSSSGSVSTMASPTTRHETWISDQIGKPTASASPQAASTRPPSKIMATVVTLRVRGSLIIQVGGRDCDRLSRRSAEPIGLGGRSPRAAFVILAEGLRVSRLTGPLDWSCWIAVLSYDSRSR